MSTKIRRFKKGDGKEVSQLLKLLSENSVFSEQEFLNAKISTGFVAEQDNQIVGFVSLCYRYVPTRGFTASVEDLVVHENYRRMGIADKLLDCLIKEGKDNNLSTINLSSNDTREGAIDLYLKKGFKRLNSRICVLWL